MANFVNISVGLLSARLLQVLVAERIGSFSIMALSQCTNFKAVELLISLGFPMQIRGKYSALGYTLWQHLFLRSADLERTIKPYLLQKGLVDLSATFHAHWTANAAPINPIQAALIIGEASVLNLILASTADMEDRNLHQLVFGSNSLNMYHVSIKMTTDEAMLLSSFKLMTARMKSLALFSTLWYEEEEKLHLNVLETLLRLGYPQVARFLYYKGAEPSPEIRRHPTAPSSILDVVFRGSGQHTPDAAFFEQVEPVLLDPRVLENPSLLESRPSILSLVVQSSGTAILTRLLQQASQDQKDQALFDLSPSPKFNETHEKLLLLSGADPQREFGGHSSLSLAVLRRHPERVQLAIQVKGQGIASKPDSSGKYLVQYAADYLQKPDMSSDPLPMVALVRTLLQAPSIKANKEVLEYVLAVMAERARMGMMLPTSLAPAAALLKAELEKLCAGIAAKKK